MLVATCSQHQYASQHNPTADTFPDSNRVAGMVSDASVWNGRLGASNNEREKLRELLLKNSEVPESPCCTLHLARDMGEPTFPLYFPDN
jgi:hypothetical protein